MQRFFLVGGVIAAVLALGVALYFVFAPQNPGVVADPTSDLFGDAGDYQGEGSFGEPTGDTGVEGEEVAPRLFRVTGEPVAEGVLARIATAEVPTTQVPDETTEAGPLFKEKSVVEVRYVERASGNAYSYNTDSRVVTRISNRTLPGIMEAIWTNDGAYAFLRFLSESTDGELVAETYALPVAAPDEGYLLEPHLGSVIISGTSTVVTLLPSTSGSVATAATAAGGAPKTLFTSPLSSLRLLPVGTDFVGYTKASADLDGYGFLINGKTGVFERLVGPFKSLTLLPSPSGATLLYSYYSQNALKSFVMDMKTRESVALPIEALPEKCVWASDERSLYCSVPKSLGRDWPDLWYQGATSFSDRLWQIDLEARTASLILDTSSVAGITVDGISLAIDPNDDYLFFANKRDGSLWAYDL